MPYPNMPDKYKYPSLVTAKQDRKYRIFAGYKGQPYPELRLPDNMIFTYGQFVQAAIKSHFELSSICNNPIHFIDKDFTKGLIRFPEFYGASMTAVIMEELIDKGVNEFIIAGWAGTLKRNLDCGQIVICDRAIRDEGVSHHYIKPGKYVSADKTLVKELATYAKKLNIPVKIGTTWTVAVPHRETAEEVKAYSREGTLTVELEAATVFAMAKKYGVRAAAVFVTLDSLAELMWKPLAQLPLEKVPTALHLASRGKFMPNKDETPLDRKTLRKLEDKLSPR
jgi:hypothetical protein